MNSKTQEKTFLFAPLLAKMLELEPMPSTHHQGAIHLSSNYKLAVRKKLIELDHQFKDSLTKDQLDLSRLHSAAGIIKPTSQSSSPKSAFVSKRNKRRLISAITLLFLLGSGFLAQQGYLHLWLSNQESEEIRYRQWREEKSNPREYLIIEGENWHKDFWGKVVLTGIIKNNAAMASFKSVVLRVTWFSASSTKISSHLYTVQESIGARLVIPYKLNTHAPAQMTSAKIEVVDAKGD